MTKNTYWNDGETASERIDHVAKVHEILRAVQALMDKPSEGYQDAQHVQNLALSTIAGAQVHATLALVEQQRIANLVKYAEWLEDRRASRMDSSLVDEIEKAIGV